MNIKLGLGVSLKHTHPTSDKLCLPKQTFPCGKLCTLEESMLKDAFYTSKSLDHIYMVVV